MELLESIILTVDYLAIIFFAIINGSYILLNIAAFFSIRRSWFFQSVIDYEKTFQSEFYKPLSIIVPAYNEAETISDNIRAIMALQYPEFEIIVVNDGSSDNTFEQLHEEFELVPSSRVETSDLETEEIKEIYKSPDYPELTVVDKKNGGKADALNAGINVAQFPLVCNIDADSLIDGEALLKVVEPFTNDWRIVAAGGSIRIANDCEIKGGQVQKVELSSKPLVIFQVVEYLRAFLFGRVGWAALNSLLIISGAFGVFKRKFLVQAGGYSTDTVGEDMELVLKLTRYIKKSGRKFKIVFLPDPVCWTQAPEDRKSLASQRRRWQRGLGESLIKNKEMFLNWRYGLKGLIAFPFFVFVEFLSPIFEFIGYTAVLLTFILGIGNLQIYGLFFVTAILLGVLLSTISVLFEELTFRKYTKLGDILKLFVFSVLENFGYRQLHTWWRLQGIFDIVRGKSEWGEQKRKKFRQQEDNHEKDH